MAKKMELNELDDLFAQGKDFTLIAFQVIFNRIKAERK